MTNTTHTMHLWQIPGAVFSVSGALYVFPVRKSHLHVSRIAFIFLVALKNNLTFLAIIFNVSAMAFHLQFFIAHFLSPSSFPFWIALLFPIPLAHSIAEHSQEWAYLASPSIRQNFALVSYVDFLFGAILLIIIAVVFITSATLTGNRLVLLVMSLEYMIVFCVCLSLPHANKYTEDAFTG